MSELAVRGDIPQFTLGWRLRRSLEYAGISMQEMAAQLDYSRGTITRWCHDDGQPPRPAILTVWALRCGVNRDWLETGQETQTGPKPRKRSDSKPRHSNRKDPHVTREYRHGHSQLPLVALVRSDSSAA